MKHKTQNRLKFIPTQLLKAILDHPNTQGIDGTDYEPVRHELELIYFERQQSLSEELEQQRTLNEKAHQRHLNEEIRTQRLAKMKLKKTN
jgi:hypothetical protein